MTRATVQTPTRVQSGGTRASGWLTVQAKAQLASHSCSYSRATCCSLRGKQLQQGRAGETITSMVRMKQSGQGVTAMQLPRWKNLYAADKRHEKSPLERQCELNVNQIRLKLVT